MECLLGSIAGLDLNMHVIDGYEQAILKQEIFLLFFLRKKDLSKTIKKE